MEGNRSNLCLQMKTEKGTVAVKSRQPRWCVQMSFCTVRSLLNPLEKNAFTFLGNNISSVSETFSNQMLDVVFLSLCLNDNGIKWYKKQIPSPLLTCSPYNYLSSSQTELPLMRNRWKVGILCEKLLSLITRTLDYTLDENTNTWNQWHLISPVDSQDG